MRKCMNPREEEHCSTPDVSFSNIGMCTEAREMQCVQNPGLCKQLVRHDIIGVWVQLVRIAESHAYAYKHAQSQCIQHSSSACTAFKHIGTWLEYERSYKCIQRSGEM